MPGASTPMESVSAYLRAKGGAGTRLKIERVPRSTLPRYLVGTKRQSTIGVVGMVLLVIDSASSRRFHAEGLGSRLTIFLQ